jgi:hypothetical protein
MGHFEVWVLGSITVLVVPISIFPTLFINIWTHDNPLAKITNDNKYLIL